MRHYRRRRARGGPSLPDLGRTTRPGRRETNETMHHATPNPLGPTPPSKPTSKAASPLPLSALTDSGAYNNDGIGHSLVGAAWSIPLGLSASEDFTFAR